MKNKRFKVSEGCWQTVMKEFLPSSWVQILPDRSGSKCCLATKKRFQERTGQWRISFLMWSHVCEMWHSGSSTNHIAPSTHPSCCLLMLLVIRITELVRACVCVCVNKCVWVISTMKFNLKSWKWGKLWGTVCMCVCIKGRGVIFFKLEKKCQSSSG